MIADRLEALLHEHVVAGEVLGLTWLVAEGDDLRTGAIGTADEAGADPVATDAVFRISSLSKPIVAAGALALVDAGALGVDDPVDRWLPELADRRVLRTPDAPLDDTVPAVRPITARDLLTSTMGIGWDFDASRPPTVMEALDERGLATTPPHPGAWPSTDDWLQGLHELPLHHQPGERWMYHTSYDVLGALVARVAGQPLGAFLGDAIFRPLGMPDTGFWVPRADRGRFGACFGTVTDQGRAVYDPADGEWTSPPAFESGGGGLVSTVADYFAFVDMLRRGGRGVLSAASVEAMTTNHCIPPLVLPPDSEEFGWGFGLSVAISDEPDGLPAGAYGWDGGLGSIWRTDPAADIVAILLTNQAFLTPEPVPITRSFRSIFSS